MAARLTNKFNQILTKANFERNMNFPFSVFFAVSIANIKGTHLSIKISLKPCCSVINHIQKKFVYNFNFHLRNLFAVRISQNKIDNKLKSHPIKIKTPPHCFLSHSSAIKKICTKYISGVESSFFFEC